MSNIADEEQAIFDEGTSRETPERETPEPQKAPEPEKALEPAAQTEDQAQETPDKPANAEPQREQERPHDRGDLNIALKEERKARQILQRELEEARAAQQQLIEAMKRGTPQQQPQPAEKPNFWELDPDEWGQSLVQAQIQPIQDQMFEMRAEYSRRDAVREHGQERVEEAKTALEAAVASGRMNGQEVARVLRSTNDPFGEILHWYDNQPETREARLRAQIETEFQERYGLKPQPTNAPSVGAMPPHLPSLTRAVGTAGAQQGDTITEDDIFQAAPAFGRRKG